jgi:hypothetical protein
MRQAWPPQSKNGLWSLFGPSKISRTVLFAKPILLTGGKIAQIGAESQFSLSDELAKLSPNRSKDLCGFHI